MAEGLAAMVVSGVSQRIDIFMRDRYTVINSSDMFKELLSKIQEMEQLLQAKPISDLVTSTAFMNLAHDIENAVEWHILETHGNIRSGGRGLFRHLLTRCSGMSLGHIDPITSLLSEIQKQIDSLKGKADDIHTSTIDEESDSITPSFRGEHVVGVDDATLSLIAMLMNEDGTRWPGIAITGRVGVANTTIATNLYYNPDVQSKYDLSARVSVGEDFREMDVVKTLLEKLGFREKELIMKMEMMEMMEHLYDLLKSRKCLVLLDDIWSIDVWDCIRFLFPTGYGSRIIITTQFQKVARHLRGIICQAPTTMDNLELFKMHSGISDSVMESDARIKEMVNNILSQCQDSPLAIVEVAKFLKGNNLEGWDGIKNFMQEGTIPDPRILEALASIYYRLPIHLKPVFLYLGQFPLDHLIPVDTLCLMIMADGLISNKPYSERIGKIESCLKELADRRLVITVKNNWSSPTRGLYACRVPNLIHYLCKEIGKKEDFILVDSKNNKFGSVTKRMAVNLKDYVDGDDWYSCIPKSPSIRSLVLFGKDSHPSKSKGPEEVADIQWTIPSLVFLCKDTHPTKSKGPEEVADLQIFQWTRVLDFNGVDFGATIELPKNIDKLLYLRYLGFRGCHLDKFTLSFSNFLYLETLDLRVSSSCKMIIPNDLSKLSNLIHLYFPKLFQRDDDQGKLKLRGMKKLQVIENFPADLCDADDILSTEDLHVFTGRADGSETGVDQIIDLINGKTNLHHSSLTLQNFDCYSEARQILLEGVLKCNALHSLHLEGHLTTMPKDLGHLAIGQNFVSMVFDGSEFTQDPMPILGKLPQLSNLVLCNDAIVRKEIYCSGSSFKKLQSFKLSNLQCLEKWTLDLEGMPHLSFLIIEQCHKLQRIPDELMKRDNLTEFKIASMPDEFEEIIRQKAGERFLMIIKH